jgi:hypothetical protein
MVKYHVIVDNHSIYHQYYRFQINCTFLPKSEIFYMPDVNNLCSM